METKGKIDVLEIIKNLSDEEIIEIHSYVMKIINKKD